jgi:hypothetical protein
MPKQGARRKWRYGIEKMRWMLPLMKFGDKKIKNVVTKAVTLKSIILLASFLQKMI